jgi:hypothetical protein
MKMRRLLLFSPALLVGLAISLAVARPVVQVEEESGEEATLDVAVDSAEAPDEIVTEAPVGEVLFPHLMHVEALEIACDECHHETSAKPFVNPHPQYFKRLWGECKTCHRDDAAEGLAPGKCSSCHPASPDDTSDETLSAKVVVHRQCWNCHDVGVGSDASQECSYCHAGPRVGFAPTPR